MDKAFLNRFGENNSDVDRILGRSVSATCGIMEREVSVRAENVEKVKRSLRAKGFIIIGTSEPGTKFRKVWFIRSGGF